LGFAAALAPCDIVFVLVDTATEFGLTAACAPAATEFSSDASCIRLGAACVAADSVVELPWAASWARVAD
jgi:hypothetical protein